MAEREEQPQDDVKLPEERVEDLEPTEAESDDVRAGREPGKLEMPNLKIGG